MYVLDFKMFILITSILRRSIENKITFIPIKNFTSTSSCKHHVNTRTHVQIQHEMVLSGDGSGYLFVWSLSKKGVDPVETFRAHEKSITAIKFQKRRFFTSSKWAVAAYIYIFSFCYTFWAQKESWSFCFKFTFPDVKGSYEYEWFALA